MTTRKKKTVTIKTGLEVPINTVTYTGAITVEEFDKWVSGVLATRNDDTLEYKSLLGNYIFIRKTLWPDAPILCPNCNTEMKKMNFQEGNDVDVRQCPTCFYWSTFDQWYAMHVYRDPKLKKEIWYGKGR